MVTDLEKFLELYRSFGIELEVEKLPYQQHVCFGENSMSYMCDYQGHPKFQGYSGFYTKVIFDKDGKFIGQDFYE